MEQPTWELAIDVGPYSGPLARDDFSSNRHPALSFCLSMISGQTLRVCPEEKPVPTHRIVARGHAFPDHALTSRTRRRYGQSDCRGIAAEHHQKYQPSHCGFGRGTDHHREILDRACGCFDAETFTAQRRALRL